MTIAVPTVTQRKVLPDASPLPVSDASGSSGGIVIGRSIQQAGADIARSVDQIKAEVDKIQYEKNRTDYDQALLDYDTQAEALLSGEGGLYQRQGKVAIDHGLEVSKQLDTIKKTILGNTAFHKEVKKQLGLSLPRRQLDYQGQVSSYVNRHTLVYEDELSAVRKNEALDHAFANYRNRDAIQEALTSLYVQLNFDAQRNGWDDVIRGSKTQEATSTLFVGVIDRYLAVGDVGGAQSFYNQNKKGIDGRQYSDIERVFDRYRKEAVAALGDDVRDAMAILSMGKLPANLDQLQRAVKGTKSGERLNEAVVDRQSLEDFAHKSLIDQQSELQTLTLQKEFTPEQARLYEGMARAHATIIKRLDAGDGLALAQELGVIAAPTPLDLTKPDTLKTRRREAELASDHFGVTVGPLTAGEISGLTTQLETATADQAAGLLGSLHAGFDDLALEIAGELSKGQRPEYGSAMLLAGEGPQGMQEAINIILGGRQRREHGSDLELTPDNKHPIISEVLGNMFEELEGEPLNEFIAAADALYASKRIPTGDLTFDADTYTKALRNAVGGVIEFNGRKVIPPTFNMDESEFKSFVRSLTDEDLVRFSASGAAPVTGDGSPFSAAMFSRSGPLGVISAEAELVSVGPGIYRVNIPGIGFVQDAASGRAYEIDLRSALDNKAGG